MVGLVYWGPDGSARAGEGLVNLKVMSWVPGVRYSSVAAADAAGNGPGDRLTVDVSRQIPAGRRACGSAAAWSTALVCGWTC